MDSFAGGVAVVTGAGSGIGRALAMECARQGMHVAVADLVSARLKTLGEALESMGVKVLTRELDVSDADAVDSFASDVLTRLGVPRLLFNNAGILQIGETWTQSPASWQRILSINLMGVVHGINAFVPAMLESGEAGHIVNTGSVGSLVVAPGMAQYTASKMAVRGVTESLAYDLATRDAALGVSLLCPGPVLTAISDELMGIAPGDEVVAPTEHLMAGQPDFIAPEQVASRVFEGIQAGKFWIFTHPFAAYLKEEFAAIVAAENPSYREVVFDNSN
ncbi:MAG: SDR family NAD(P)-dependent oxidoreductase [Halieaceae bacterium]|jgi:NAD(P)-dependent dehydrogenase (short-subunit alcohol dehydrogenase family)|nr:SDR family NAD(P)-dependent oxidoreductase [Halieaceae bacterium]